MGGGRVQGGEKKFPWKHFPVYLTIVPPAKTSQISPLITSKPVRVPCCDSTASQMFQRMQHWAADIYFQFHMDFHHGVLGSCAWGCQAQLSVGCSKGQQRPKNMRALRAGDRHTAWLESSHIMEKSSTILPPIFPLLSLMSKSILAQAMSCTLFPHLRNVRSHVIFLLKRNLQLLQRFWNKRRIFKRASIFIIMKES